MWLLVVKKVPYPSQTPILPLTDAALWARKVPYSPLRFHTDSSLHISEVRIWAFNNHWMKQETKR